MLNRIAALLLGLCALALPATPALAQGVPVFQMGTATPGDIAVFARNGQIQGGNLSTILGPSDTTANGLVVWNSTTGSLLKDGLGVQIVHSDTKTGPITTPQSPFTVHSNQASGVTGLSLWQCINFSCGSTPAGQGIYSTVESVTIVPAGSTINGVGGFMAYMRNDVARVGDVGTVSAGYFSDVVANADGAGAWGANFACTDALGQGPNSNNTRYCFNEVDMNINSPNSEMAGWMFGGLSTAQPARADALLLNSLDGFPGPNIIKWTAFLRTNNGTTLNFANIGAQGNAGASVNGQTIVFNAYDAGSAQITAGLQLASTGSLVLNAPTAGSVSFLVGAVNYVNIGSYGLSVASGGMKVVATTVAGLPTCNAGAEGTRASVTNATEIVYGNTLVGGGAFHVPAYCTGSTWING